MVATHGGGLKDFVFTKSFNPRQSWVEVTDMLRVREHVRVFLANVLIPSTPVIKNRENIP